MTILMRLKNTCSKFCKFSSIEDLHTPIEVYTFVNLVSNHNFKEAAIYIINLYINGKYITVIDCMQQTRTVGADFRDYEQVINLIKIDMQSADDKKKKTLTPLLQMLKQVRLLAPQ